MGRRGSNESDGKPDSRQAGRGRRRNREGQIVTLKTGGYLARIQLPTGRHKSHRCQTEAEAVKWLTAQRHTLDTGGVLVKDERLTVKRWLENWLESKRPDVKPQTLRLMRSQLAHVIAALGHVRLTSLNAAMLERLYADLLASGKLAASTVSRIRGTFHSALADAERLDLIARNPASRTKAVRSDPKEMTPLDAEQAQRLLAAARGDRLEALYTLALATGMRSGEMRALRWRDVDLKDLAAGQLDVRGTLIEAPGPVRIGAPKTKKSRRKIALDPAVVEALRAHKARQTAEKLKSGLGAAWGADAPANDLVFTTAAGSPVNSTTLLTWGLRPLLRRAGLPPIRLHDLRHTFATLALQAGVRLEVVSETLGHASYAITLNTYAHVLPQERAGATAAVAKVLFA